MYLKFVSNLFLETIELNVLKQSIDDSGFRMFLLDNSLKFGVIKNRIDNTFDNAKVEVGSNAKTIKHKEIRAIDKNGNLIYRIATDNITIPADNTWYWVKIKHNYSSIEEGTVSIDTSGNLTGVNTKFLSKLRGQPNFPSKIRFTDATNNLLEYEVLQVINDTSAILQGDFITETTLHYSIVGTFTPGYVVPAADKDIFQYDNCTLSLVIENPQGSDTPPAGILTDEEFYIARIKTTAPGVVTVQDKRADIWKTREEYFVNNVIDENNALIGVESIKYDHPYSTRAQNIVYLAYNFRSTTGNWSINTNINTLTITAGEGGKFKTVADFMDGDFDGWRLYREDGKYCKVISSIKSGGAINLLLDSLITTDFGLNQTILVTPDAEEIEIVFDSKSYLDKNLDVNRIQYQIGSGYTRYTFKTPYPDISKVYVGDYFIFTDATFAENTGTYEVKVVNNTSHYIEVANSNRTDATKDEAPGSPCIANPIQTELPLQRFLFPINKEVVKCYLLAYRNSVSYYSAKYRYKHMDVYSELYVFPSDTTNGFYNENQWDDRGNIKAGATRTTYASDPLNLDRGFIPLNLSPLAYRSFYLGDLFGVAAVSLNNASPTIDLTVGVNKNYQYVTGALTLTVPHSFDLKTVGAIQGNTFFIHLNNDVVLNGQTWKITQDGSSLLNLTQSFVNFITKRRSQAVPERGLLIRCTYDGSYWQLYYESVQLIDNQFIKEFSITALDTDFTNVEKDLVSLTPSSEKSSSKMTYIFNIVAAPPSTAHVDYTMEFKLYVNGVVKATWYSGWQNDGGKKSATFIWIGSYSKTNIVKVTGKNNSGAFVITIDSLILSCESSDAVY